MAVRYVQSRNLNIMLRPLLGKPNQQTFTLKHNFLQVPPRYPDTQTPTRREQGLLKSLCRAEDPTIQLEQPGPDQTPPQFIPSSFFTVSSPDSPTLILSVTPTNTSPPGFMVPFLSHHAFLHQTEGTLLRFSKRKEMDMLRHFQFLGGETNRTLCNLPNPPIPLELTCAVGITVQLLGSHCQHRLQSLHSWEQVSLSSGRRFGLQHELGRTDLTLIL